MKCPKCGAENPEGSMFCQECGTKLTPETNPVEPSNKDGGNIKWIVFVILALIIAGIILFRLFGPFASPSNGYDYDVAEVVEIGGVEDLNDFPELDYTSIRNNDLPYVPVLLDETALLWDNLSDYYDNTGAISLEFIRKTLHSNPQTIRKSEILDLHYALPVYICSGEGWTSGFSFPAKPCSFTEENGNVVFKKTTGDERKKGTFYVLSPSGSVVFLGTAYTAGQSPSKYGSNKSIVGTLYKLNNQYFLLFAPYTCDGFEHSGDIYIFYNN